MNFTKLCISKFEILLPMLFLFFSSQILAQVGINTTSPSATLDVNGDFRVRNMTETYGDYVITTDTKGNFSKTKTYLLYDAGEVVASGAVGRSLTGDEIMEDIDLDLEVPVLIPANKEVKVIITYSVPMGTILNSNPPNTYIGATFFKDNTEIQQGSRKVSLSYNASQTNDRICNMSTITNSYVENFSSLADDLVVKYSIKGYIEQYSEQSNLSYSYKFNMWQPGNSNYNWGKASVSYQVYIK
tara:strand:+ start:141271 stop:141999 length:729 start_codon:yes stop_codon:yes gene_type:complete